MDTRFAETRVRVNVTSDGTLLDLTERGAVVQLRAAQTIARQTTVALTNMGETLHLPARVLESVPHVGAHRVTMEFFNLPRHTLAAVRRLVDAENARAGAVYEAAAA
jgi:hypothetical protein